MHIKKLILWMNLHAIGLPQHGYDFLFYHVHPEEEEDAKGKANATSLIDKYDLNPEAARQIEELCGKRGVKIAGRLPYHTSVIDAMVKALAVVEIGGPVAEAIEDMWKGLEGQL